MINLRKSLVYILFSASWSLLAFEINKEQALEGT